MQETFEGWNPDPILASCDAINPEHYKMSNLETIDIIRAMGLMEGFCVGNIIKYITRAGKKGPALQDLQKAQWYLSEYIKWVAGD